MSERKKTFLVCLGLILGIAAVFGPAIGYGFVFFDDQVYLQDNRSINSGFSWSGFLWAFQTGYAANWHPVTWLSHMLDCQLYGLNPAGHHATNILLHAANSTLVFLLLKRTTGKLWPSAVVAALFVFHPLRLESVIWISERKDVLSVFFALLTIWAYVRHAENDGDGKWWRRGWYWLAVFFFCLALMSKPMVVTLPPLLLLLDIWPLRRWPVEDWKNVRRGISLLLEKAPLFLLSAILACITVIVQKKGGAVTATSAINWQAHLAHVPTAYGAYVAKIFFPGERNILYLWRAKTLWDALPGALLVLLVSTLALRRIRPNPWLAVGWFWFLIALLPVIGIVQVGTHFITERFTYLPSIGLTVMVVFGLAGLDLSWLGSRRSILLGTVASLVIASFALSSFKEREYWRSSEALFGQAMKIDPQNYFIRDALAGYYRREGKLPEAQAQGEMSVALEPRYGPSWNQLGNTMADLGQLDAAADYFRRAIKLNPKEPEFLVNLATILKKQRQWDEARQYLAQALAIEPDNALAHGTLATILDAQKNPQEAVKEYKIALQLNPYDGVAYNNLGVNLMAANRPAEAQPYFQKAVQFLPKNPQFHYNLACARALLNDGPGAAAEYRATLQINGNFVPALQRLSWWLSTNSRAEWRDAKVALSLAQRGCEVTQGRDYQCLAALDAALAESGRFEEAIQAAENTASVAASVNDTNAAQQAQQREQMYRAGQPYHAL